MDLNTLYTKIFPIGGIDDNNRYIDMTGDEINTVQLTEPSLSVKELVLAKSGDQIRDKYAHRIPIIAINDHIINQVDICEFVLDYSGFVPTVMFSFYDTMNTMISTNVVKDGCLIKIYIGGQGDELYYKPIRQDFILTSIRKIGGGIQNIGDIFKYRVYGKLNVPYGYIKESRCMGTCTARQALFNLSIWTGLGFSTNFTKDTLDKMKWINTGGESYFDFMEEISAHACYSPNTFFTSFIDQYNVLNFVECHSLLSHGGDKTDTPAMIYRSLPPYELPEHDSNTPKTTKNQLPLKDGEDDFNNSYQRLSYYFISNNDFFDGWSNFIEEYYEIVNTNTSLSDGFKINVNYTDSNVDDWGFMNCRFVIRPIDNLQRELATQKIKPLEEYPSKESYIPLNLAQTTRRENVNLTNTDDITGVDSFRNFGEVDTTNMFKQYFFAEEQNKFQMKCMKKCGLRVKLQNYNPAITKFSRIWVDIYDKNKFSDLAKKEVNESDNGDYLAYKNSVNENILQFDDEAEKDTYGTFNRSLSGWYVVTEIEIVYDFDDKNLKMNLVLNRIEYKPCFVDEYKTAKKAIDKYKEENLITNILK